MAYGSPELKKVTYFVLNRDSSDWGSISPSRHVVAFGSGKHKYLFLNAGLIYSSHNARAFYLPFSDKMLAYYKDLIEVEYIWLQHGVTQNDISKAANRLNINCAKICCATLAEQKEFLRPPYFYDTSQVPLTGFARYDKLKSKPEKVITFALTWRPSLTGKILPTGAHAPKPGFTESPYFIQYKKVLCDRRLIKILHDKGYKLEVALHPALACYEEYFRDLESANMHLIPFSEISYSKIFERSLLLVTDYSSVAFDFAYLKKPVLYYQFDEEEFFSKHYSRGYYDYRKHGFGPVCNTEDELISEISVLADADFAMPDKYVNRVEQTFKFTDKNNCERILAATLPEDLKVGGQVGGL